MRLSEICKIEWHTEVECIWNRKLLSMMLNRHDDIYLKQYVNWARWDPLLEKSTREQNHPHEANWYINNKRYAEHFENHNWNKLAEKLIIWSDIFLKKAAYRKLRLPSSTYDSREFCSIPSWNLLYNTKDRYYRQGSYRNYWNWHQRRSWYYIPTAHLPKQHRVFCPKFHSTSRDNRHHQQYKYSSAL